MDTTNGKTPQEEIHHGRYNEPSPAGTDAYGIRGKAMAHMASLKKGNVTGKNEKDKK